eukprot:GHVS01020876.1.p1 GENE.GHVS01020876.1~~GHVS01020876.1.p1  ORF type:complete len:216 (+),score=21.92 GHVS01020876.1:624-1271(+)
MHVDLRALVETMRWCAKADNVRINMDKRGSQGVLCFEMPEVEATTMTRMLTTKECPIVIMNGREAAEYEMPTVPDLQWSVQIPPAVNLLSHIEHMNTLGCRDIQLDLRLNVTDASQTTGELELTARSDGAIVTVLYGLSSVHVQNQQNGGVSRQQRGLCDDYQDNGEGSDQEGCRRCTKTFRRNLFQSALKVVCMLSSGIPLTPTLTHNQTRTYT